MEYSACLQQIQTFLETKPLIILGSGSSAAYGLPLMNELSDEIRNHSNKFDATEFAALCNNLSSMNIEEAIDKSTLSESSLEVLRRIVWKFINERDLGLLQDIYLKKVDFALAKLLSIIIRPTPNIANIVTTNYDRLAEYATDLIRATAVTGFEGNLIRISEFPNATTSNKRILNRERVVNIWKVHGSLDWFSDNNNGIVSFPLAPDIPFTYSPLIIAPGKGKYSVTHSEPYRDIITQADNTFSKAGSYLCIGYGFNDDHIQPKLIEQIKNGKPIVVLCHTATEACKQNVISTEVKKYVVIEYSSDGKTSVIGNGYSGIYDGDFWNLSDFIKAVWR